MTQLKSIAQLTKEIKENRQTLNHLALTSSLQSEDIIVQSQKLDKLLNEYELRIKNTLKVFVQKGVVFHF